MKKMSFKCIFNWLYAKTLNRAMSDRQPREDREMNHSVYRPVCVSYVSRTMLVSLFLLVLGGWNTQAWGATLTGKTAVGSGKGTAKVEVMNGNTSKGDNSTTGSTLVSAQMNVSGGFFGIGKTEGYCKFTAKANPGYKFDAWYTNEACTQGKQTGSPYTTGRTTSERTDTYYAKFTPNKYIVTFKANGGSVETQSKEVTYDAKYGDLPVPTRRFYKFDGWYTTTDGGLKKTSETTVSTSQDHTLYAHWILDPEDQTLSWGEGTLFNMAKNTSQPISVSSTSGLTNFSYESENESVISIVGESLQAKAPGETYILVTESGNDYYKEATLRTKFSVWSKETPVFKENGFEESGINELKVGDVVTVNLTNVSAGMNGDFKVSVSTANVMSVVRDGDVLTFSADHAGTTQITVSQTANSDIFGATKTYTFNVTRYEPEFSLDKNSLELEQTATLSLTNVSGYSISFVPEGIASYDNKTGKITATGVGSTELTISQPETNSIASKEAKYTITVSKKTPTLSVKMAGVARTSMSVNRGSTVSVTFDKISDASVAVTPVSGAQYASYVEGVMTAGVVGTATYRATLPETDTYKSVSADFSLTVTTSNTHLPISITTQAAYNALKSGSSGDNEWSNNNGVGIGETDSWTVGDWDDKYVTFKFEGIPDKLTFDYIFVYRDNGLNKMTATPPFGSTVDGQLYFIYVDESADGYTWSAVMNDQNINKDNWKSFSKSLKKTTRYIRFHLHADYGAWFKNIKVSELKYVEDPDPDTIDFGSDVINAGEKSKTSLINWCNIAPLTVTSNNPRFTVTPASFGNFDTYSTQSLTVKYTHTNEDGNNEGDITISNGDATYTKIIHVKATTTRRPQTITWNAQLAATGFAMNVGEQYPDETITAIATATSNEAVTYTSSNPEIIAVIDDTKLLAKSNGKVTITAHQAGDGEYQKVSDEKEFTVTLLQKQTITWNQNLYGLLTTSGTIELTATATSGGPITYTSANESIVKVEGNVLTVVGEGETYITATQGGYTDDEGVEWLAVSQDNYVIVRNPASQCSGMALSQGSLTLNNNTLEFPLSGIPETLTFKSKHGTKSALWGTAPSYAPLIVEQFAFRNNQWDWFVVYNQVSGTDNTGSGNIGLDESATKIRFSTIESGTDYTVNNIKVTRKKFMRADVEAVDKSVESNAKWEQIITVSHSNIDLMTVTTQNGLLTLSTSTLGEGCGDFGDDAFTVSFTPSEKDVDYEDVIVITDGKAQPSTIEIPVRLHSEGLNQTISGFEVPKTCVSTDLLEPFSATASTGLPIAYHSSDSTIAYVDGNNRLYILSSGTVSITARQDGDNKYDKAEETQSITITKATPAIATVPTSGSIQYLQTLENSTIANDGVATVTLRGVANTEVAGTWAWTNPTQVIKDNAGTHEYQVTFTPTDKGMYNNKTCMVPVTILHAPQAIAMNNGSVRVAVDGIDAGKADSKIDLDDLIASQTSDPVNNNRVGAVTYEVISDNKANAAIAEGNIFSATAIGDYTIRATKAETDYYNVVTDDFVVKVSKRANTMAIAGTEYERFVDEEIADIRSLQNSDATVQTSSTSPTIAYYDVESNKILIPNSESDEQMFGEHKEVTIKIWQEATDRFEACEKTITLVVKKYVTASNGENYELKVNETKTANYGFTNTSASYPSNNPEDDFYYTIDKPNFENEALNNGTELITYNPATNEITGLNAGTTKITFFQKETYKYTGATLMCNIAVEKRSNQISNSWSNVWQKAMKENGSANISFTSTHGDYANYPISIEQIYGEDVATLTGTASGATIATNTTKGYAIWHLSQAENYEYYSAEADVLVTVGVEAPPTCYVYEDMNNEHSFSTSITDAEGHFETPISINSPIDKIWFKAKRQWGGFNYFTVQYSTDDGKTWGTVISPDLGTDYAEYSASFPTISGNKRITHVRFGAKTGATLSKWYKDVRISRKAYLTIQDAEQKKISKLPTMTCTIDETSTAEAKFYIDYSTCADEITIESSNPEHFTVSRATINVFDKHDNLTSAKEEITVTYSSTELGTHNAVITVRTFYQTCALSVSGETTKRTPTLTWREGYESNPLTLPVGLTVDAIAPAATTTSTASVMYESDNENVVKIINNGYAFMVVGVGTATLTAVVPENDKWKSVSDTRVINATAKVVQEIVWNQTFPRFMEPGNVIDLDAKVFLRNLSTSTLEYSEERSRLITYSCPLNNNIVSISGNKMTIQNYGEVKITASVSGDADYEASTMTILLTVRQPSAGCETPLVLNKEDAIDMYEVNVDFSNYLNLTTEEMISGEIKIDHSNGKPDKLSFQYEGEEYVFGLLKYFGGVIKFEQRVNQQWIEVAGSRVETVKNEWNARNNLQLDEQADALRIIRESGATGHHYIKDIQVTRKQYLRATKNTIDLGEVTLGQATPVTIGFEYSDIKGDLTARTINNTTDVTIKDNGAIDLKCGSFGHYDLPITFTPTHLDDWQGEVEIYDNIANLSITVELTASVVANEEYIFNHEGDWNTATNWTTNLVPDENADITVVKNMTINSAANVKSITIMDSATVTVKSGVTLVVGSGTPKNLPAYGNLHVEEGAQVLLDEEASLPLNDLILDAKLGTTDQNRTIASNSGQITNESQLIVNGDAYFRLALDPDGHNTYGWYDFTVPFEVDVIGGISIAEEPSAVMKFNDNYAVMDYSEAKRAVNGKYWNKFTGTMLPGHIYTITLDADKPWNTVVFKKKAGASAIGDRSFTTEYSGFGVDNKDNGWNGFGNGTLHHTELDIPVGTLIQVYDHANKCYHTREAKDYSIAVGMTFVMQVPSVQTITLLTATSNSRFLAPARESSETDKFRLSLQAEGAENASDYLWVSASEDATGDYIIGRDVMKMGTMSASNVARIWSVRNSLNLCSNEMPMVNGEASCPLNIYAPAAGSYTLAIDKAPENANLYLTYNGNVIWDLTASPYSLDLTKGTTTGYGLQLEVVNAPLITTGVDEIDSEKDGNRKVIINDAMYIITKEGAIFNATGKKVK